MRSLTIDECAAAVGGDEEGGVCESTGNVGAAVGAAVGVVAGSRLGGSVTAAAGAGTGAEIGGAIGEGVCDAIGEGVDWIGQSVNVFLVRATHGAIWFDGDTY